jgi:hypothetical protein
VGISGVLEWKTRIRGRVEELYRPNSSKTALV